jgi:aminoglycoside phosphotransferase family enzyme/predicted kinase
MNQTETEMDDHLQNALLRAMLDPKSYCHAVTGSIVLHETHISWVFLAGDSAYKIKKPLKTSFLDYSSLAERERLCHEEVRLNGRYTDGLYLGVVSIRNNNGRFLVEAPDQPAENSSEPPIEFAVWMRRFPESAVLSTWIRNHSLTDTELRQLARSVASSHLQAKSAGADSPCGTAESSRRNMSDALDELLTACTQLDDVEKKGLPELPALKQWTANFFAAHQDLFVCRKQESWIRECHGDLHLSNIVRWNGDWVPFDGIEFNDDFRWIDVLNDAAFLAMDFASRGQNSSGHQLINNYLEQTGDYFSLSLLKWYLVYRALVRARVAAMRFTQQTADSPERQQHWIDCSDHVRLAHDFTQSAQQFLWITHGVSGSGKTTGSEWVVRSFGAIRVRSDVERKRLHGRSPEYRSDGHETELLYSTGSSEETYGQLKTISRKILEAGFPVIVDATFLRSADRREFRELAKSLQIPFGILHFDADVSELKRRLQARQQSNNDASDANVDVLERQLQLQEPLTADEHQFIVPLTPER